MKHNGNGPTRREVLCRIGGGFGVLGLSSVLSDAGLLADGPAARNPLAPRPPHFPARAKRLIFLFMNGGPSHVDSFDPKPELTRHHGEKLPETFGAKSRDRREICEFIKQQRGYV